VRRSSCRCRGCRRRRGVARSIPSRARALRALSVRVRTQPAAVPAPSRAEPDQTVELGEQLVQAPDGLFRDVSADLRRAPCCWSFAVSSRLDLRAFRDLPGAFAVSCQVTALNRSASVRPRCHPDQASLMLQRSIVALLLVSMAIPAPSRSASSQSASCAELAPPARPRRHRFSAGSAEATPRRDPHRPTMSPSLPLSSQSTSVARAREDTSSAGLSTARFRVRDHHSGAFHHGQACFAGSDRTALDLGSRSAAGEVNAGCRLLDRGIDQRGTTASTAIEASLPPLKEQPRMRAPSPAWLSSRPQISLSTVQPESDSSSPELALMQTPWLLNKVLSTRSLHS